ncbi:hypothetical protein C4564_01710 [Candidatus Microgenomates bacterium]|nr:MAG: hypothetical protein C4564_01710 [Candidatus Microgenomates bacterium]
MSQIDMLINQLQNFEATNPPDTNVLTAWKIMYASLEPFKRALNNNDVVTIIHGSMQYNDPHHLDLDLAFVARDDQQIRNGYIAIKLDKIQDAFEGLNNWPSLGENQGHCHAEITPFSIEKIKKDAQAYESGARVFDGQNDSADLFLAYILSSKLVYPEQEEMYREMQNQAQGILRSSPILRNAVTKVLEETLKTRQERNMEKQVPRPGFEPG